MRLRLDGPPDTGDELPHADRGRGEFEGDRTAGRRIAAGLDHGGGLSVGLTIGPRRRVGLADLVPGRRAGAADDHPVCRRHPRDVGRQAGAAAMVRRDEHVARPRVRRDEPAQRLPLEVTREEQPASGRLDCQHEARLVVVLPAAGLRVLRMQHADAAERIDGERVAPPHEPHRDTRGPRLIEQVGDGGRAALEKRPGDDDLPHRESLQEFGHGVEVVGVGMGDHERVDAADPLVPEHSSHAATRGGRRAETAGVVEEAAARRAPHQDAAAMPHRRDHDPQRRGIRGDEPAGPAGRQADAAPGHGQRSPGAHAHKPLPGHDQQHRHHRHVPAGHPPSRRSGDPAVSTRHPGGP